MDLKMVHLKAILSIVTLVQCFLVPLSWSCSPPADWKPPTLVDEILGGERILYGRVKNTYPDTRYPTNYAKVFTVEFEVFCVLKGAQTALLVNISDAGYIPGHCVSTEFVVNHDYIAIVHSSDGSLNADRDINATESNLLGITKACGLNHVTRPQGSTSEVSCPVSTSDCISDRSDLKGDGHPEVHEHDSAARDTAAVRDTAARGTAAFDVGSSALLMITMIVATVASFVAS